MLKETFQYCQMPEWMTIAIITLIFNKVDSEMLKNYRPISLTKCDYKILAYLLAKHMQKVIKNIVHNDQTAYIKGRYIGSNIRIINDILEFYEGKNSTAALIFLIL